MHTSILYKETRMDHADEYLNCEGTESTPLDIEI